MSLLAYSTHPKGLTIQTELGWCLITPYSTSLLRIQYNQSGTFNQKDGFSVCMCIEKEIPFSVVEKEESLVFSTSKVSILIDKQTLAFTYLDEKGNILVKEPARGGKTLEPVDVYISNFDEMIATESNDTADGVRIED